MNNQITFLDVEASGLGSLSYPIQVGWVDSDGNEDEFLINPNTSRSNWNYWDKYAETNVHGISRERCVNEGLSVYEAARRINNQLRGLRVISDARDYDWGWLLRLFKEAGIDPLFELYDIRDVLFSLRENPRHFFNERKARPAKHTALLDCVRNLHSGAACGIWTLSTDFTQKYGNIEVLGIE